MYRMNRTLTLKYLLIIFLLIPSIYGQKPTAKDYYRTAAELGIFLYLQYGIHADISDLEQNEPNSVDQYFRDQLRWGDSNMEWAKEASDILLYGVFIGTLPIMPLFSNDDYMSMLLTNIEVLSINGTLTNLVKELVKRQRPASYYKTRDEGEDAYRSFFSGHSSATFSIGTSTAMMLSRRFPEKEPYIWTGCMGLAAATAYFRVAADKHYMSDILVGALTGITIGKMVQNKRYNKYLSYGLSTKPESFQLRLSINID